MDLVSKGMEGSICVSICRCLEDGSLKIWSSDSPSAVGEVSESCKTEEKLAADINAYIAVGVGRGVYCALRGVEGKVSPS